MKKIPFLLLAVIALSSCNLFGTTPTRQSAMNENKNVATVASNENSNAASNTTTFQSKTFKFSVEYPKDCTAKEDQYGVNFSCDQEEITFIRQADIPRIPLPDNRIEKITVSGMPATLYHDTDNKTGADQDVVIFDIVGSDDDMYIRGLGPVFEAMLKTVKVEK